MTEKKLPLGVMPRRFWVEHRVTDLMDAITRRLMDGRPPKQEWVFELSEHLEPMAEAEDAPEPPGTITRQQIIDATEVVLTKSLSVATEGGARRIGDMIADRLLRAVAP